MDNVSLLGQDHAGQAHAGAPEVIWRSEFPKAKEPEDEQHREKDEPHLVNRVTPIKNESGRNGHRQRSHSGHVSSDQWLKLKAKPDAADADEDNGQPQRPDIPAKQSLREQEDVKMKRPVIIRRVVFVEPVFHHLIDKPAVDSFVEMRWLDAEQKKTQENSKPKNQPWRPPRFREARSPRFELIAQYRKIC